MEEDNIVRSTERLISNVGLGFIGVGLLIHGMLRISYYTVKYLVFGP